MFGINLGSGSDATLNALSKSLGIIEFDPVGNILTANENFCRVVGYSLEEIKGKHHSVFVDPDLARSADYRAFWEKLGRGEFDACEYKRIGKGGREVWIQASYNPVKAPNGTVLKVVKIATDITQMKMRNAEFEAKINAISRSQGVIEFTPDGHVITANENFLTLLGYRLEEIQGKHHSMFVETGYGQSGDYREFWRKLNAGEFASREFIRFGKGGKQVWIRASYNPVFDLNNKVVKVVKFATDITDWGYAVKQIGTGLLNLAENNLEYRLGTVFNPAFEELRANFNTSLDKLQASMLQIAAGTSAIHTGAQEITTAADDLSHRTETQAANLEETAGALNQITATVKSAADGAAHARQVVATADEDAKQSAIVVGQTVEAMAAISKSAQQISQIIGVIDEIAFQTNLLALNAGVEAARAGDAGRGFAVVASEVRALAQRSAEAAKEIKTLISTSTTEVEHGVKLVAETGKSLERILKQVNEINTVVAGIASGAKDQATGLAEINSAITQMDQVTQQNAAMVEETTAASHSLSSEALRLANLLGQFKTGQKIRTDMRGELQKVAPRSFGKPSAKVIAGSASAADRARPRMVFNGAAPAPRDDWREF